MKEILLQVALILGIVCEVIWIYGRIHVAGG